MPIPMPMLIPICPYRFPSGRFPEFCQFRMQKKESALEMKNLFDFPYSFMYIRPSDEISLLKDNNKKIKTRYETCLKLKLKNKYTKTTLSNGVLLSLLLCLNVFFTKF